MAFTTPLTVHGYTYAAAYIKATIARCDTGTTVVKLDVWPTQADRQAGAEPVRYDNDLRVFDTNLSLQTDNPVAYAYALLEDSDEFAEAIWNVN